MHTLAALDLVAGLLAGCISASDDGDFPVQPAVQPTIPGAGSVPPIISRVCVLSDPRDLTTCSATGAGGLTVSVGAQTVTTAPDGTFAIAPVGTEGVAATVSGEDIVTTTTLFEPANTVPVLPTDLVDEMFEANGITLTPGAGSILGSVVRNGLPVPGITATTTPTSAFGPFFDGASALSWSIDATGARGITFIPGITAGPATLTFLDPIDSAETTVDGVQVIDGGITYVDAVLP